MKKNITLTLIIFTATFILSGISYSQSSSSDDKYYPSLDKHKFTLNSFIPNPFILTTLSSNLGFANSLESEISLLKLDSSDNKVKVKADITYANGQFGFQYAVKDWAAIYLKFSGIARLGTNTASIFASGVTANTSFTTGMLFKIKEFKKSLLSTGFSITNSSSTTLNIYPFIKTLLDSTYPLKTYNIVNSLTPLSGAVDLRFAYSPGKPWSILSFLETGYGENTDIDKTEDNFFYVFGATANYNFDYKCGFPLGVGAGFKFASNSPTLQYTKKLTQYYLFQLAYTGKKDFTISLESNFLTIPTLYDDITIKLTSVNFGWAYYF
ncbi:MAG TPA: hypothetical protein PKC91_01480 [Ignavibacteria bacterium]|nr:hypothetical protein [Ignavibacteria bacterium]